MRNAGTPLWQGFEFEWAATPHRLKHLTSRLDDLEVDDDGVRGTCSARLTVGQVPDRGFVRTRIGGLRAPDLYFIDGEAIGQVQAARGEKGRFVGERVCIDLDGADPDSTTAVLRGFELTCTSHPVQGLHVQGFSLGLADMRIEHGVLSFLPRAWVRANVSPDFVTSWRRDFSFEIRVLYTAILGTGAHITYRLDPCLRVEHVRGQRSSQRAEHQGRGGFGGAAVGLRGFRWDQRHQTMFGRNGRFVRHYQALIGHYDYDTETGRCGFDPALWFSNDGLLPWPARSEHRLWTTLIETSEVLDPITVEQPIATGLEAEPVVVPFALQ